MPKCQTLAKPKIVSVTKKNKNIVTKIVFICHIFLTCPVETGGGLQFGTKLQVGNCYIFELKILSCLTALEKKKDVYRRTFIFFCAVLVFQKKTQRDFLKFVLQKFNQQLKFKVKHVFFVNSCPFLQRTVQHYCSHEKESDNSTSSKAALQRKIFLIAMAKIVELAP